MMNQEVPAKTPPILRQDLRLMDAESSPDGQRAWMLYDPLSARYFRLGQSQMELLSFLDVGDNHAIAVAASDALGTRIEEAQVESLFDFLRKNSLVVGDEEQQSLHAQIRAKTPGWMAALAKSYLFIRVPLFKADHFLERTSPYVRWLVSKPVLIIITLLGIVGLIMTMRQLDTFWQSFSYFFGVQGAIAFGISMVVVKILHELGHAYVAKAHGCHVPIIGVTFLVLWPVLYTDNTDTWRLQSRRTRLQVGVAGVGVELAVAALALFAWNLSPDGILRSVFFTLATTTWMASVLINFNPLMRFDGYYLFSDYLREPNLESRSHALARWWLRRQLFGFFDAPPERPKTHMIIYSMTIWVYRFFLFLGIALLVYYMFFKVVGIVLFAVEIVYFILAPLWREGREWWKRRQQVTLNPYTLRSIGILGGLLVFLFIPWKSSIEAPAILQQRVVNIHAPVSGKLASLRVQAGQKVEAGQVLGVIAAPDLNFEVEQATLRYIELSRQRSFLGFNPNTLEQSLVISSTLRTQKRRLDSLVTKQQQLIIKAPESGTITDLDPNLIEGQWMQSGTPFLVLKATPAAALIGYLNEADLQRVAVGKAGKFYAEDDGKNVFGVTIIEIEKFGITALDEMYSASLFGGNVAVTEGKDKRMIPAQATYRLRLAPTTTQPISNKVIRGALVINSTPQSIAEGFFTSAVSVLQRESSF